MSDATDSDTREQRLAELLERRRVLALSDAEHAELESILDADPLSRTLAERLDQEDQAMNATIDSATAHFDFDKARRALAQKDRFDRIGFRISLVMAVAVVLIVAVLRYPEFDLSELLFIGCAMALGLAVCTLLSYRRVRSARAAMAGRIPLPEAYDRHLRASRVEWTAIRAAMIIGGLGFVLLAIDSAMNQHWLRLAVVAVCVLVVGPSVWRTRFGRGAQARYERFLSGELSLGSWASGKEDSDESDGTGSR